MSGKFDDITPALCGANDNWPDRKPMPELPRPGKQWTVGRKAAVVQAVRDGWLPVEDICDIYNLSVDQFLAWEREIDHYDIRPAANRRFCRRIET